MKEIRRSLLQVKILLQLEAQPTKTISELSERLKGQRPSVSRSMRILKTQGLVSRDNQGWQLTEAGKTEVALDRKKLAETTQRLKTATLRSTVALQQISSSAGNIMRNFYPQVLGMSNLASFPEMFKFPMLTAIANLNAVYLDQLKNVGRLTTPFLSHEFYDSTMKPLLDIQERNSALLLRIATPQTSQLLLMAQTIVNQNNLSIAKSLNDLMAVQQVQISRVLAQAHTIDFSWLAQDISKVTQAFAKVFSDQLKELEWPLLSPQILQGPERWVIPSVTMTYYTNSAHSLIEAETDSNVPALLDQGFQEFGDQSLDSQLHQLNPDFVEMRHGVWLALCQLNPDRLRHAATSQRELIRQLMEQMVPGIQLPPENRQGTQLKARIKVAFGTSESNAEFINSVCVAVIAFYDQLNKYTHHNEKHEESLRAILHTGEGIIRFILSIWDQKAT
jgi:predicted transcriptional regulator